MKDLIGKRFPVKDESGKIIGYRKIKRVFDIENFAQVAISTYKNSESLFLLSYKESYDLIYNQNKFRSLKELKNED